MKKRAENRLNGMKSLAHSLFGMIFNLFRLCPVKEKKVVLFMIHNSRFKGNLRFVYEQMKAEDPELSFVVVSKKQLFSVSGKGPGRLLRLLKAGLYFYFGLTYHLATAGYIFLNDNFLPLAYMRISPKTKVVQLWHGIGALKRFGLSTEEREFVRHCVEKGNQRITHLFVSSQKVVSYYKEALGIAEDRIFPVGVPVTDYYFDRDKMEQGRKNFFQQYPELAGKKLLLYTPTFRKTQKENEELMEHFDCKRLKEELGESWAILVRSHPQVSFPVEVCQEGCYNVTEYEDIKELYVVSDVLVNDYSSTMVEFALLGKPIVLYAYDLESYDRGFYRDYRETAPGKIVRTQEELCQAVLETGADQEKLEGFLELQYDIRDGKATERVISQVLKGN